MFRIEAARNVGVRFSMPCHILAVFCVCVCVCTWLPPAETHRELVTGVNCFRGLFVSGAFCFGGLFVSGAFCFGGLFVLGGFLTGGLIVWWLLFGGFSQGLLT